MPTIDERYVHRLEAENDVLRTQVEDLQFRIVDLEGIVRSTRGDVPVCFPLSKRESQLLGVLMIRPGVVTKDMFLTAMYGGMNEPDLRIMDVYICKMRKKLARFGIKISTKWGVGHFLTKEMKAKVREYHNMGTAVAA